MSRLRIFSDSNPQKVEFESNAHSEISNRLSDVGIRFEQWHTHHTFQPGADPQDIIKAYRSGIDRLMAEEGYTSVDVVSLSADHPQKAEFRQKFLNEHTHSEDEVRFFVGGSGLFSLHLGDKVYEVLCEKGDLISVPDNTKHWFDMGPEPSFIAIRLFTNPSGWVAEFTGTDIAQQFPRFEIGQALPT